MLLGSGGISARTAKGPPFRRRTSLQSPSASSVKTSSGERLADDPRLLGDLALELARAPAGVAREDARPLEAADIGSTLDLCRQEADRAEHERGRLVGVAELPEHHDRLGLDRAADVHELGVVDEIRERRHRVGDRDRRGPVEDHAHRTLVTVLADEEDAAAKVRVQQIGTGNE